MAKANEKIKTDATKEWLLDLERRLGKKGLVVSLLICQGKIQFLHAVSRKSYFDTREIPDDEGEYPEIDLTGKVKKDKKVKAKDATFQTYMG